MNQELELMIRSRQELIFSGKVKDLTSSNRKGIFDILPKHEQFITLISGALKFETVAGERREINVESGVLRVYRNRVSVFLEAK